MSQHLSRHADWEVNAIKKELTSTEKSRGKYKVKLADANKKIKLLKLNMDRLIEALREAADTIGNLSETYSPVLYDNEIDKYRALINSIGGDDE